MVYRHVDVKHGLRLATWTVRRCQPWLLLPVHCDVLSSAGLLLTRLFCHGLFAALHHHLLLLMPIIVWRGCGGIVRRLTLYTGCHVELGGPLQLPVPLAHVLRRAVPQPVPTHALLLYLTPARHKCASEQTAPAPTASDGGAVAEAVEKVDTVAVGHGEGVSVLLFAQLLCAAFPQCLLEEVVGAGAGGDVLGLKGGQCLAGVMGDEFGRGAWQAVRA
mmetsp:Transcript_26926/g.67065  ORF Transcript_26926/g.67065 Transcript_26926/m.67065 type:complete len:218 (+) Transcript_26926:654-1307(+)